MTEIFIPVMEFIQLPIRHIPEKHRIVQSFNQWRTAILLTFGNDPLKCECGTTMLFLELYLNHQRVTLEETYEKVMSRSRGRRSSA